MLNLIEFKRFPILSQLKLEEALLRTNADNWCLINYGASPAIVMGISQSPEQVVDLKQHQMHPIPIIRRYSGGGTVVIEPTTLLITLILNHDKIPVLPFPKEVHRWTETLYKPAFVRLPFSLKENDYCLAEKKCGGNAQYFAKGRIVHHTSFVWDYSLEKMTLLKMPPKMPCYRNERSHVDFLSPLKEHFPSLEALSLELQRALSMTFSIQKTSLEKTLHWTFLPHRKASTEIDLLP